VVTRLDPLEHQGVRRQNDPPYGLFVQPYGQKSTNVFGYGKDIVAAVAVKLKS
jgi:hypothetical protein